MEIANLLEDKEPNKIYGLYGNINITTNNRDFSVVTSYKFGDSVKDYLNSPKASSSLKMVMLDDSYLTKKVMDLSETELAKISLAKALIENKEYLVLDYFDKGLNANELENYKRLFKKLNTNYKKTIIIFTNDITFMWDIVDEVLIVDENKVTNTIGRNDILKNIDLFNQPEIIRFIKLIKEKGKIIENYRDPMDLLKAIYRMKESENNTNQE